jgi:isopenicillin N synthase-like dioxygenase
LLSRQRGVGGLQAWDDEGWFSPPYSPDSLVVNLGDLMERWTDGRWRALKHRVLPPSPAAPDEELLSLVFFFESDPDTLIEPLAVPTGGGRGLSPVYARRSVLEKLGFSPDSVPGAEA